MGSERKYCWGKSIPPILILALLLSCGPGEVSGPDVVSRPEFLAEGNYNPRNAVSLKRNYVRRFRRFKFRVERSAKPVPRVQYSFKSARPLNGNVSPRWYYRWRLRVEEYPSVASAVREFNRIYASETRPPEPGAVVFRGEIRKGNNARVMISGKHLYRLSASCLEGDHRVRRWFRMLERILLKRGRAEKKTVLLYFCGGGFATN